MQNKFDFSGNLVNHDKWSGALLLWGLVACKQQAVVNTSRLNGVPLSLVAGEMTVNTIGLWLKTVIAVLVGSSTNSLAICEGGHLKLNSFLVVKTVLSGAYVALDLFVQSQKGRNFMNSSKSKSTNLTTSKNKKAIILLYATDRYHKVKQKHIQDCCKQNGIEVIKIITCRCHYDHVMLCDLVKTIKNHNEPVDLIVESGSYYAFTQIMTCSVFATLSVLEMVDIYTYVEPTVDEKSKLTPVIQDKSAFMLIAEYHYDQLLDAAKHKLPIIAQLYGLK